MKIVAVHLMIDVVIVAVAIVSSNRVVSVFEQIFASGMVFAQLILLSSWLGFSQSAIWKKVLGCVFGVLVVSMVIVLCYSYRSIEMWLDCFRDMAMLAGLMTVPSVVTRLLVLRVASSTDEKDRDSSFQFSTRSLFFITTAIAAMITLSRVAKSMIDGTLETAVILFSFSLFGWLLLVSMLWAGLGSASPYRRLIACVVIAPVLGAGLTVFIGEVGEVSAEFAMLFATAATIVAITLLAVRLTGVRLVRVESWLTRALFR